MTIRSEAAVSGISLPLLRPLVAALAMVVSSPAFAHPGHLGSASFAAGLLHPLTGIDHLAAMLLTGLWAGTFLRRWFYLPPLTFVAFMLAGFSYGLAGGALPLAEVLIFASVVVLGSIVLFQVDLTVFAASALTAVFALAHGYVHSVEMPSGADVLGFGAGLASTMAVMPIVGVGLAWVFGRRVARMTGGATMTLGLVWIFAT